MAQSFFSLAADAASRERASALRNAKWQATGLLGVMAVVFCLTWLAPPGLWVDAVRAMAEAAMVGALADWFAVSALFRRIPLPVVQRHTDIIARNKDRIGSSLADFVRDRFMDAPSLVEMIRRHDPATLLARWIAEPANGHLLGQQVARLALAALDSVEDARIQRFVKDAARSLLGQLDLSRSMAAVLEALTHESRHQALLNDLITRLAGVLRSDTSRAFIAQTLVLWLKREHPLKEKLLPTDWLGDRGAAAMAHAVDSLLDDVAQNPDHPLRGALDEALARWIVRLQADPDWLAQGERVRSYLLDDATLGTYADQLWGHLRARVRGDLLAEDSATARTVERMGRWLGQSLAADEGLRAQLNTRLEQWVAQWAPGLAQSVAEHIRSTVQRWDARDMAQLVELHIGQDLQYIRINGTVVGALVGLLLFVLTHAREIVQALGWG